MSERSARKIDLGGGPDRAEVEGPLPKHDPRVQRTREVALAAALEILLDEGWDALTHVRVAAASGLSRMTLYRQWPTAGDLLRDVLAASADVRHPSITGDLRRDLMREMDVVRKDLLSVRRGRVLAAFIERAQHDTEIGRIREDLTAAAVRGVRGVLESAMADGSLPATMNVNDAIARLVGPCTYRLLVDGQPLTRAFVRATTDDFLVRHGH